MKKVLMLVLAMMLCIFSLAACTSTDSAPEQDEITPEQTAEAEAAVEDAEAQTQEIIDSVSGEMELAGSWQDEISQRASMDVTKNDDGSYDIVVSWGGGATETAIWQIHGTYDEASGMLSYEDGVYTVHTWDESGAESVTEDETTKGVFMKEGEKLRWQDSKNSEDGLFVLVSR